jgi:Putative porin
MAVCAASVAIGAEAPDPLLDLFVKKGFVTQEEADKVKAEADAMRTNELAQLPGSKWKINNAIKNVELFGDLRLRYEDRTATDPKGGSVDLNRLRYAVRIGLRGEVYDDFYYGVRIETSTNPRSSWVTFGSSASAPFGKSAAGIGIGQVYLGWKPTDWADITVGKMPNPFYTTAMTWDPDLNPEGLAERFKYTVGQADIFANFGQFIYEDPNPTHASAGYFNFNYNNSNLPFVLGWQLGVNYHVTKTVSFKVAPALYNYTGRGANNINATSPDFSGVFVGQGTTFGVAGHSAFYNLGPYDGFFSNETGINDLLILDVPWELNVKVKKLNVRLFGDYAQNLDGGDRARAAFGAQSNPAFNGSGIILIPSAQTGDDKAYQIGLAVGNKDSLGLVTGATAKRHAWEIRTYWQHVEQYSLDPNLIDSDFFADLNMEGVYAAVAYGLTDNMIATFRYGYATRINDKLGTGGSNQDIPQVNPYHRYNLLQLDLTMRF